jgi:hypothetical protein
MEEHKKKSEPKQNKEEPKPEELGESQIPPPAIDPKTGQPRKWPEVGEKV